MVKCKDCGLEMTDADSCTVEAIKIDNKLYERDGYAKWFDEEWAGLERCGDCGILMEVGNVHHFGCDIERCPKCGGQLISCNCKKQELLKFHRK